MRLLLDTHCWIWMQTDPERFSKRTREILIDPANELMLSVASIWELVIKTTLGKLRLPADIREYVTTRNAQHGIVTLAIVPAHAFRVAALPTHHRDPFDRMLAAQSLVEDIPLLTSDPIFRAYRVATLRAR